MNDLVLSLNEKEKIPIKLIEIVKNTFIRVKIQNRPTKDLIKIFLDNELTKKLEVYKDNKKIATYCNYTKLNRIAEYNDGTWGIDMAQPMPIIQNENDKIERLKNVKKELNKRAETAFLEEKVADLIVKMKDLKPTSE